MSGESADVSEIEWTRVRMWLCDRGAGALENSRGGIRGEPLRQAGWLCWRATHFCGHDLGC